MNAEGQNLKIAYVQSGHMKSDTLIDEKGQVFLGYQYTMTVVYRLLKIVIVLFRAILFLASRGSLVKLSTSKRNVICKILF